jgi:hypothetical protein
VANAGTCVANPAIEPLPTVPGLTIFMLAWPVHCGSPHVEPETALLEWPVVGLDQVKRERRLK